MQPSNSTRIAIAVIQRGDEVLIGLRGAGRPLGGFWEFPGGKVEQGETCEQAAVREALEETGIRVSIKGEFPPVEHDYDHGKLYLRFFQCAPVSDASVISLPSQFLWVKRCALRDYQFPPANDTLLNELMRMD